MEWVVVESPVRPGGVGEQKHRQVWERAARAVREEAGGVALALRWP